MLQDIKTNFSMTLRDVALVWIIALGHAILARIVLFFLSLSGDVTFVYNASGGKTTLDKLCGLINGAALISILATMLIIGGLFTWIFLKLIDHHTKLSYGKTPLTSKLSQLITGSTVLGITLAVALLCFAIVASGFLSHLQLKAILSKAGHGEPNTLGALLIVVLIITSLATVVAGAYLIATRLACAKKSASCPAPAYAALALIFFLVLALPCFVLGNFSGLNQAHALPKALNIGLVCIIFTHLFTLGYCHMTSKRLDERNGFACT